MKFLLPAVLWCVLALLRVSAGEPAELSALRASAEKGDAVAMFQLYRAYEGEGEVKLAPLPADARALANAWLEKAAGRGHPQAMFELAIGYMYSQEAGGLGEDLPKMEQWLIRAGNAGVPRAMAELGAIYYGDYNYNGVRWDYHTDQELGVEWYKKAANAGWSEAFQRMAEAYLSGKGAPHNPTRAIEWLTRGTTSNDEISGNGYAVQCMAALATLYLEGKEVPKEEAKAADWLRRATEAGDKASAFRLGELYLKGVGVPRDLAQARELLAAGKANAKVRAARLDELTAAEKAEAVAKSKRIREEAYTGLMPDAWLKRRLVAPKELENLQATDVFFMAGWRVRPPPPGGAVNRNDKLVGEIDFSSMRIGPGSSAKEGEQNRRQAFSGTNYVVQDFVVRGSDLLGRRITVGWVAYVVLSDWWPAGYGYPNEGVGIVYGGANLDEALNEGYRRALTALRQIYSGPIRCMSVEAGMSAVPDWDLFSKNKTRTNGSALPYHFGLSTPSTERDARDYGFTMPTIPGDSEQFAHFVRTALKGRYYISKNSPFPGNVSKSIQHGSARSYGGGGFQNAPVVFNRHSTDLEWDEAWPTAAEERRFSSDEPPPLRVVDRFDTAVSK